MTVSWKKRLGLGLVSLSVLGILASCGTSTKKDTKATDSSASKEKMITVDVFDNVANYMGIQKGWFGQIVKDKFNIELNIIAPNVAGNGDTLYQTRSAAGDVGDIVITGTGEKYNELVEGGLLLDSSDLYKDMKNLSEYDDAVKYLNDGKDGVYGFPIEVSNLSPDTPMEGLDLNVGPYLRWDLYAKQNYPKMETLEDLLPVLKSMQDANPKTADGKNVYSFSLFADWDGNFMGNAGQIAQMYGYDAMGFELAKADGSDFQDIISDDSAYIRALKLYFDANQMGLVDPESTTQNWDTLFSKFQAGQVLYSWYPWLGQSAFNTTDNIAKGVGYMMASIDDQKLFSNGAKVYGGTQFIGIGSKAEDPERIAEFIDWLYSPEGIAANDGDTGGAAGVKDWTYKINDDGLPELTDFGVDALVNGKAEVPAERGGGTFKDGVSTLNVNTVLGIDTDPETKAPYYYNQWETYQEKFSSPLQEDWSKQMGGAKTAVEFLEKNDQMVVAPGATFVTPQDDSEITTLRSQIGSTIKEYSWKMVFAKDEGEFNSMLKEMQDTADGLGYKKVLKVDLKNAKDQQKAREEISEKFDK